MQAVPSVGGHLYLDVSKLSSDKFVAAVRMLNKLPFKLNQLGLG